MIKSVGLDQKVLKFDRNKQRIENSDPDIIKKKQKLNENCAVQIDSNISKQVESYIPELVKVEKFYGKLDFYNFGPDDKFVEEDLDFIVRSSELRPVDRNDKKEKFNEEVRQGYTSTSREVEEVRLIQSSFYIVINQVLWKFLSDDEKILTLYHVASYDWLKFATERKVNFGPEDISNEAKKRLKYKYESWEETLRLSYFCSSAELLFFIENVIGCQRSQIKIYLTLDYPKRITGLKVNLGIKGNFFNWFYRLENLIESFMDEDNSDRSKITEHLHCFLGNNQHRIINLQYFQHLWLIEELERSEKDDYSVLDKEFI